MHAFRKEVFPLAVPPDIRTFISNSIASHINDATSKFTVLFPIKSIIVQGSRANFLIVIVFPFVETGPRTALTLSPVTQ